MASSLMAAQSTLLRSPITSLTAHHPAAVFPLPAEHSQLRFALSKPKSLSFSPLLNPLKPRISASISAAPKTSAIKSPNKRNSIQDFLSGPTRTVTTLGAVALTASKFSAGGLFSLALQFEEPLLYTTGAGFFAAVKYVRGRPLDTPLAVVATGMAKWLNLYSEILMVRCLLSWFPNIPWHRQPFSAIRDLCDPFLNLFRNIIPPICNVDVSSFFAFYLLGAINSIMRSRNPGYLGYY